jgi:hypothetical protein
MTPTAIAFAIVSTLMLLLLPRRWAPFPLLAGACYMTVGQSIEIGPFTFTVLRLLIAAGFVRAVVRGESLSGRWNWLDSLILAFGAWLCISSVFHQNVSATLVTHLGLVYGTWGIYFLLRIFCSSVEDVSVLCRITALVLLPVALAMIYEQTAFRNIFSVLGGVPPTPQIRDGRIRAFGPFAHPILAGTVGGVVLPLMIGVWRLSRPSALVGILSCLTIVGASASSGPVMSAAVGCGAMAAWPLRKYARLFRWTLLGTYLALLVVMDRPPYYVIQRLEVVGGSTGWYRSRLIESAFEHIDEWWIGGTDYTRHWMTRATTISETHTDITNHYLAIGVMGGLPLLLLFVATLVKAFSIVGRGLRTAEIGGSRERFVVWGLGCSVAAHTVTCISVSYFDQSFLFLYLPLAAIASAVPRTTPRTSEVVVLSRARARSASVVGAESQATGACGASATNIGNGPRPARSRHAGGSRGAGPESGASLKARPDPTTGRAQHPTRRAPTR